MGELSDSALFNQILDSLEEQEDTGISSARNP